MRIFKTKVFIRFQRKEAFDDTELCEAIRRAETGLVDADLGHGLIKQRIARAGGGRRGGFRTIIAYRREMRAVFIFGFAKSGQENISAGDMQDLADTGALLMALGHERITTLIEGKELMEVICHEKN